MVNRLQEIVKLGSDEWYLKEIDEEYADPSRKDISVKKRVHIPSILSEDTQKQTFYSWDCTWKVHQTS
jgi:hypothetical protein